MVVWSGNGTILPSKSIARNRQSQPSVRKDCSAGSIEGIPFPKLAPGLLRVLLTFSLARGKLTGFPIDVAVNRLRNRQLSAVGRRGGLILLIDLAADEQVQASAVLLARQEGSDTTVQLSLIHI